MEKIGLKLNKDKSGIIHIGKPEKYEIDLNDNNNCNLPLPLINEIKYLGLKVKNSWTPLYEDQKSRLGQLKSNKKLIFDILRGRPHKHEIGKTLWQQYLLPKTLFAHSCLNFTKAEIKRMAVEENKAARELIFAPLCTHTEYVKREANIGDIRTNIKLQKILLLQHILKRQGSLAKTIDEDWDKNIKWIKKTKEYLDEFQLDRESLISNTKQEIRKIVMNKTYDD